MTTSNTPWPLVFGDMSYKPPLVRRKINSPSLIVKPTEACNFKCTFCSSTDIQAGSENLDLESIFRYLERFPDTPTIIINGGDPLMVKPEYYWKLIEHLEEKEYVANISFTSNLWAFYKKPEMWEGIFKHPRVGVATSFQYGNARLKGDYTPYTEKEFWEVSNLFLERVGYRPEFIAVITKENEDTVIQTVELAKKMGVVCKVNYAMASGPVKTFKGIKIGNADSTYVLADIYQKYIEIYEAGLAEWEHNTSVMMTRLTGGNSICPQARSCDKSIRSLQPGNKYYSCGAFGDDGLYPIDFEKEMSGGFEQPLVSQPELQSLKQGCFTCPMFEICNGCRKTIHDLKRLDLVETHCFKMKTLATKIIDINGLSGKIEPTPYEKEL
jgi:sulfatase maturation enzyme AslB (radical SAM superfamily)